jgi:hypothetical protein
MSYANPSILPPLTEAAKELRRYCKEQELKPPKKLKPWANEVYGEDMLAATVMANREVMLCPLPEMDPTKVQIRRRSDKVEAEGKPSVAGGGGEVEDKVTKSASHSQKKKPSSSITLPFIGEEPFLHRFWFPFVYGGPGVGSLLYFMCFPPELTERQKLVMDKL